MNLWAKLLIGAGAITGVGYFMRMQRMGAEIETISTAKIHKLDLSGLTIRVDVKIKNPTKGSLKIQFPFVKIIYQNNLIGSSQSIDKNIVIPANGEAQIEAIMIDAPILTLLTTGASIYKALQQDKGIEIEIKTISTISLGFKSLPYEKTEKIVLKK